MSNPAAKNLGPQAPLFDAAFLAGLEDLIHWRRDVRRFRSDAVDDEQLNALLALASRAPSVGNSQPWRFVKVADADRRASVIKNFETCNKDALGDYDGEQARIYASLKLAGLQEAPVHLAVFCDKGTLDGHGLGRKTMPEMLSYSVVGAVNTLWLAARAQGLGMGWVSILDAEKIGQTLDVPKAWSLIAYLCIGYPQKEHLDPELERAGWQERLDMTKFVLDR